MSAKSITGVYPLVCVSCRHVVGAINVSEFEAMTRAEESYVCHACMESDPVSLEAILLGTPDGKWAELTLEAINGAAEPLSVRRKRHEPHFTNRAFLPAAPATLRP
ncbi:MAG: hypothetical protein JXA21_13265 [Anaerolineae bacterium]|nr:hypothetical protein [Anaerolineae bacterium]